MSSKPVESPSTPSVHVDVRGDARDSRLSVRKSVEEDLRKLLLIQARELCKDKSVAFGQCAKEHGMMVVFKCKQQNLDYVACVSTHYNEVKFEELLVSKGFDIANRVKSNAASYKW